jgi:hypothetical protein
MPSPKLEIVPPLSAGAAPRNRNAPTDCWTPARGAPLRRSRALGAWPVGFETTGDVTTRFGRAVGMSLDLRPRRRSNRQPGRTPTPSRKASLGGRRGRTTHDLAVPEQDRSQRRKTMRACGTRVSLTTLDGSCWEHREPDDDERRCGQLTGSVPSRHRHERSQGCPPDARDDQLVRSGVRDQVRPPIYGALAGSQG